MRTITDHKLFGLHKLGGLNDAIDILALDTPDGNRDNIRYEIYVKPGIHPTIGLKFQQGNPKESINGISNETLVAILIDRLRFFQSGQFSCRENAVVLTHFEEGLMWLQKRSYDRIKRGVEGKEEK